MNTETKYHKRGYFPLLYVVNTLQMYVRFIKVQSIAIGQGLPLKKKNVFILVLAQ